MVCMSLGVFGALISQEDLSGKKPEKQPAKKKKGFMGTLVGFALGTDGCVEQTVRYTIEEHAEPPFPHW